MQDIGRELNDFIFEFAIVPKIDNSEWILNFGNAEKSDLVFANISGSQFINEAPDQLKIINKHLLIKNDNEDNVRVYKNPYYESTLNVSQFYQINLLEGNLGGQDQISGFGQGFGGSNNYIGVGAPYSNNDTGIAFIFYENSTNGIGVTGNLNFGQVRTLSGSYSSSFFGANVSAGQYGPETVFAISATGENNTGAVYIYTSNGSIFSNKLIPTGQGSNVYGKHSKFFKFNDIQYLAISYEKNQIGYVDLYKENNSNQNDFILRQELSAQNSTQNNLFGNQVEFGSDQILISSPGQNNSGSVFAYKYNFNNGLFEETQEITSTGSAGGDFFGKNIAFTNSHGLISSNENSGKAYIYAYNQETWSLANTIETTGNYSSGNWGGTINKNLCAVDQDHVMVASYQEQGINYYEKIENETIINNKFSISGKDGKLYNNEDNFIYGYNSFKGLSISGNVFDDKYNLFINDKLLNSNQSRITGVINLVDVSGAENLENYSLTIYETES